MKKIRIYKFKMHYIVYYAPIIAKHSLPRKPQRRFIIKVNSFENSLMIHKKKKLNNIIRNRLYKTISQDLNQIML